MPEGITAIEVKLAQKLASNVKKVRYETIRSIQSYIRHRKEKDLTELELLKLWKGLFYCVWMSDKVPVQQELIGRLVNLFDFFPSNRTALLFYKTFLLTMTREWQGIDRLRLDKFYSLQTQMLQRALQIPLGSLNFEKTEGEAQEENENEENENEEGDEEEGENDDEAEDEENNFENEEDNEGNNEEGEGEEDGEGEGEGNEEGNEGEEGEEEVDGEENEDISNWIDCLLNGTDIEKSPGVILHISDIYISNLLKFFTPLQPQPDSISETDFTGLLYPFFHFLSKADSKSVKDRIQKEIFEKIISTEFENLDEEELVNIPSDPERYHLHIITTRRFSAYFNVIGETFESVANLEETTKNNKAKLLNLSKKFLNAFTPPQKQVKKPLYNPPTSAQAALLRKRKRKPTNKEKQKKLKRQKKFEIK